MFQNCQYVTIKALLTRLFKFCIVKCGSLTHSKILLVIKWTASSEFGTYCLCEQRRFRRACASAQSRQNLRCSLIEALSQEEPSDRKPDPWPLWMAVQGQLKFVMTESSKTQIHLTGLKYCKALGTNIVHKYMDILKFALLKSQVLTLKDPISWFAQVILPWIGLLWLIQSEVHRGGLKTLCLYYGKSKLMQFAQLYSAGHWD